MNEHAEVDIDLLADYIGGALDGPEEAAVARLIADDPRWRETYDLLAPGMAKVGAGLQALGARPEPMPADVAGRLESALTVPADDDPADDDPAAPDPTVPEPSPDGQRHLHVVRGAAAGPTATRRRRRLRWAVPIAAAAGVLAFAGVAVDRLGGLSESLTSTDSAGQAAPAAESQASLVSVPADDRITTSGTDYTRSTLGALPAGILAAPDASVQTPPAPAPSARGTERSGGAEAAPGSGGDVLARLRIRDALVACLQAIAVEEGGGSPIIVEAVDYARFEGAPAVIVRFLTDGVTRVVAAGPDCGAPGRGTNSLGTVRVG
jgi:hypothetical protein